MKGDGTGLTLFARTGTGVDRAGRGRRAGTLRMAGVTVVDGAVGEKGTEEEDDRMGIAERERRTEGEMVRAEGGTPVRVRRKGEGGTITAGFAGGGVSLDSLAFNEALECRKGWLTAAVGVAGGVEVAGTTTAATEVGVVAVVGVGSVVGDTTPAAAAAFLAFMRCLISSLSLSNVSLRVDRGTVGEEPAGTTALARVGRRSTAGASAETALMTFSPNTTRPAVRESGEDEAVVGGGGCPSPGTAYRGELP